MMKSEEEKRILDCSLRPSRISVTLKPGKYPSSTRDVGWTISSALKGWRKCMVLQFSGRYLASLAPLWNFVEST